MNLLMEVLILTMQLLSVAVLAYGCTLVIDARISRVLGALQWRIDRRMACRLMAT